MKKFVLISIFVFIFFGCGGSGGEDVPQYKIGDSVYIVKNIKESLVPYYKNAIKKLFEEKLKESPIPVVIKFKNYESESCISFGFKFKDIETKNNFIITNFTKGVISKCTIQDHSIGDEAFKGKGGFVMFFRIG